MKRNICFSEEIIKTLARAIEYYLVNNVWDKLAERDNAAASEEQYRVIEIINKFDLKRFFCESTRARF